MDLGIQAKKSWYRYPANDGMACSRLSIAFAADSGAGDRPPTKTSNQDCQQGTQL
jgi:hypothetical protein